MDNAGVVAQHDSGVVAQHYFINILEFCCHSVGSCTAWFEPYVAPALAKVAGPAIAGSWVGSSLLPATLAYSTVKGNTERLTHNMQCCVTDRFRFLILFLFPAKVSGGTTGVTQG
jgi:hypothetical protein